MIFGIIGTIFNIVIFIYVLPGLSGLISDIGSNTSQPGVSGLVLPFLWAGMFFVGLLILIPFFGIAMGIIALLLLIKNMGIRASVILYIFSSAISGGYTFF